MLRWLGCYFECILMCYGVACKKTWGPNVFSSVFAQVSFALKLSYMFISTVVG